jgi:hypothetical protein
MKTIIISILTLFSTLTFAQLQKGKLLLSGALDVADSKTTDSPSFIYESKTTQININLKIGIFLSDKSVLGLEPGYNYSKQIISDPQSGNQLIQTSNTRKNASSISVFYRHYFPVGEKVSFFIHNRIGFGFGKNTSSYLIFDGSQGQVINMTQKADVTSGTASINPGIAFFITPKLSIEANVLTLRYQYDKQKPTAGQSRNSHDFSFQYNMIGLGISWFIGK